MSKILEEKYFRRVQAFLTGLERSTDLIFEYTKNIQDMTKGMWEFGIAAFVYVLVNIIAFLIRIQTGGILTNLGSIVWLLRFILVLFAIICWVRLGEIRNSAKNGINTYSEFMEIYGRQLGVEELLIVGRELNLQKLTKRIDKKFYFYSFILAFLTLFFLFAIGLILQLLN